MSEAISAGRTDRGRSGELPSAQLADELSAVEGELAERGRPKIVRIAGPLAGQDVGDLGQAEAVLEELAVGAEQQLLAQLEERLGELEMRLRERDEAEQLHNAELQALERDLVIKEAYVERLEFEQQLLKIEIGQVRERAAELFGDLERAEARIAELGALAADIQGQPSYRAAVRASRLVRRAKPLLSSLGRLARPPASRPAP